MEDTFIYFCVLRTAKGMGFNNMNKTILVLIPVDEKSKKLLEKQAPCAKFEYSTASRVRFEQVKEANIIIGNPPVGMVTAALNLEWLQLESAGTGDYIKKGVLHDGILLTNSSGAYGLAIAEHMLGLLLQIYKKLYLYRDNQKYGEWKDEGSVKSIYNTTALVVGLGDIGGEFAQRIHNLGGYTIGVRRAGIDKQAFLDELYHMDKLDELLPRADVVALSLPETKATYHLLNLNRLSLMKPDAVLLNVGRGTAVDTEALCDVLQSGKLMGVGLDVTEPEPLPQNHRLWKIPNAIITPHISGGAHLSETFERILNISAKNLNTFIHGGELENLVDFTTGYRKSKP
jgi:phosphoglycerate dehydrogenase-like enzyme